MKATLIIPALNEAEVIGSVLARIPRYAVDEVIVVDNGSTDGTGAAAARAGARVVMEPHRGYGAACGAARGGPSGSGARRPPTVTRAPASRRPRHPARGGLHLLALWAADHRYRPLPGHSARRASPARHAGPRLRLAGRDGGEGRRARPAHRGGARLSRPAARRALEGVGDGCGEPAGRVRLSQSGAARGR